MFINIPSPLRSNFQNNLTKYWQLNSLPKLRQDARSNKIIDLWRVKFHHKIFQITSRLGTKSNQQSNSRNNKHQGKWQDTQSDVIAQSVLENLFVRHRIVVQMEDLVSVVSTESLLSYVVRDAVQERKNRKSDADQVSEGEERLGGKLKAAKICSKIAANRNFHN